MMEEGASEFEEKEEEEILLSNLSKSVLSHEKKKKLNSCGD